MFAIILIAVLLTGGRDLDEFRKLDWIIPGIMGFIEIVTVVGLFYAAQQCGKLLLPIEQLRYRLRGAIIATHPLKYTTAQTNCPKMETTPCIWISKCVACGVDDVC